MSTRPIQNDIFPQYMTFDVTESGNDTTTSERIQMPIARLPNQNRVQVIEIVKIAVEFSADQTAAADVLGSSLSFRNFDTTEATFSNPSCFFKFRSHLKLATSGSSLTKNVHYFDYTTGGGRGFLIATDSIFAQVFSASIGAAVIARYKVWYRFVMVGMQEYVGIVQQQSAQD